MNEPKTIEAEVIPPQQTQAVAVRDNQPQALSTQRMSVDELRANLAYIHEIMSSVMKEGSDYGKIPGCGEKPTLLQPGAQKLCMTFQLQDEIKKEILREFPGMHREYELTVTLVSVTGRRWDGVGTCSTLESKYRYRKAERRCPECGKNYIIQGKAEYGGGWLCFKKKGGCGAKFAENDQRIISQPAGTTEYENPPDYWNTVRKMAFKRALVHASINATNTSELWTQDIEEMAENRPPEDAPRKPEPAKVVSSPPPEAKRPTQAAQAPAKAPVEPQPPQKRNIATVKTKVWFLEQMEPCRELATEYFQKLTNPDVIIPTETLSDVPLWAIPVSWAEMRALKEKIAGFGNGEDATWAYEVERLEPSGLKPLPKMVEKAVETVTNRAKDPEWWRNVIISVPRAKMKRDEYLKKPDTIGSLFDLRHGSDDEAKAARERLFGLVHNWACAPREYNGKIYQPTEADKATREALDAFAEWFQKNHPDEKL